MKVIWEGSDIEGGLVVKQAENRELFIISWQQSSGNFYLTSLADGMLISLGASNAEAAESLNCGGFGLFNQIRTCATVAQLITKSPTTQPTT